MSCFMTVGHQVGDVLNTSLPRIRPFASSRVPSAGSFSTSPFPFRKPATQGSCSIDHKCCNICWSEPRVTISGSCLDCVTIEGEITWWAPRHALVGEEQRLFVPFFFRPLTTLCPHRDKHCWKEIIHYYSTFEISINISSRAPTAFI